MNKFENLIEQALDVGAWWDENTFQGIGQSQYIAVVNRFAGWIRGIPDDLKKDTKEFLGFQVEAYLDFERDEQDLWRMERVPYNTTKDILYDLLTGYDALTE